MREWGEGRNHLKIINAGGQKTSNRNMLRDILTIFLNEEAHWKLWSRRDKEPDREWDSSLSKRGQGAILMQNKTQSSMHNNAIYNIQNL